MEGWFTTQPEIFVLTRDANYTPHTPATVISSIPDAIALTNQKNHPELVVAGGAKVFEQALPFATRLVLTWVESEFPNLSSPAHFPEFDPKHWQIHKSESWLPDPENSHPMTLETLIPK